MHKAKAKIIQEGVCSQRNRLPALGTPIAQGDWDTCPVFVGVCCDPSLLSEGCRPVQGLSCSHGFLYLVLQPLQPLGGRAIKDQPECFMTGLGQVLWCRNMTSLAEVHLGLGLTLYWL